MNECRQNSPIPQPFTVTLRLNLLPVKMQEHSVILRAITDAPVTDVTGNVVADVFDDFAPSCQAHGKSRRESQTCKGGFHPTQCAHLTPPAYMLEVPHKSPDQERELQNGVV